jgi:hypothetical protein
VPIWFVMALTWALWLLWPVRRRRGLLPRQRRRAVPWGGAEVLMALILVLWLWPSLLAEGLRSTDFFGRLYGPLLQAQFNPAEPRALETAHLVAQSFAAQGTAPAGAPAGALALQLAAFGVADSRAFTLPPAPSTPASASA